MDHFDPTDPRDTHSPYFYLTFIADENGSGGSRSGGGFREELGWAPLVVAILLLAALLIGAIASGLTK